MMNLIHAACLWGGRRFDGWVIARARYRCRAKEMPVSYNTTQSRSSSRYALFQTDAYDGWGNMCQSLEICLLDPSGGSSLRESCPLPCSLSHTQLSSARDIAVICFTHSGLQQFLRASGDTNPIHQGTSAIVPGLWILSRLKELYCRGSAQMDLSIRFIRPVYTDRDIHLHRSGSRITGSCEGITCFTMTITYDLE